MEELNLLKLFKDLIGYVFNTDKPDYIFYSFATLVILGLLGLTFRYLLHWNRIKEKNEWLKLDTISKLILSFLVGLASYLLSISVVYLIGSIFSNLKVNYSLQNPLVTILTLIFSLFLKNFKTKENKGFENVRVLSIFYLILSVFTFLLALDYYILIKIYGIIKGSVALVGFSWWMLIFVIIPFIFSLLYYARITEFTLSIFKKKLLFYNTCIKLLKILNLRKK